MKEKFKQWLQENKKSFNDTPRIAVAGSRSLYCINEAVDFVECLDMGLNVGCANGVDRAVRDACIEANKKFFLFTVRDKRVKECPGAYENPFISKKEKLIWALADRTQECVNRSHGLVIFYEPGVPLGKGTALAERTAKKNNLPIFYWAVE